MTTGPTVTTAKPRPPVPVKTYSAAESMLNKSYFLHLIPNYSGSITLVLNLYFLYDLSHSLHTPVAVCPIPFSIVSNHRFSVFLFLSFNVRFHNRSYTVSNSSLPITCPIHLSLFFSILSTIYHGRSVQVSIVSTAYT